jgi:YVTN family beta-propeller protein
VSNTGDDTVSVIDTSTNEVVQTVTGFNQPWGVAIT